MTLDLFAKLRDRVLAALAAEAPGLPDDVLARVEVTPPRDAAHGDMMTNAALVAAKPARLAPARLAEALCAHLLRDPDIAEAQAAGPGFINLRLAPPVLRALVPAVLGVGERFGDGAPKPGRVNVEYVSANPTGPMHVGHCRGAVVGDALANLLEKAGFAVTREYYVNDAGAQVEALGWAAYWRYLEASGDAGSDEDAELGLDAVDPATGSESVRTRSVFWTDERVEREFGIKLEYKGAYLIAVGQALYRKHGDRIVARRFQQPPSGDAVASATRRGWLVQKAWLDDVRDTAVAMMMDMIRDDLAALGVRHDVFVSERALVQSGAVQKAIAQLERDGLIYTGVLEPPKGKTPEDWEPRPQTLFAATRFGDDVDRPLRKSDGSNTYFANDIANHADKIARGHDALVHVWGADHAGYVTRMKAAVAALSAGRVSLDIVICQIVRVMKNGEVVRMSKRAGSYVTLRDLIDDVGADAVRFTMLTRKADAQFDFDLDAVVAQTRDNPVFYVQYAHARCRSVLRAAAEALGADATPATALAAAGLDPLADPAELGLIRRIAQWPRTVEAAAAAREPHRIAFFLSDLAADFHALWNRGRDDAALRFIQADDPAGTRARLALVAATAVTLRSGLRVMGVTPVEEMR
jgi:arginyl-tRNA synthetase